MTSHLEPPQLRAVGGFVTPSAANFGQYAGTFVVDQFLSGAALSIPTTSTTLNYYAVLWGSGGGGGASVPGNPVGDIIGGGGGAGLAYIVKITMGGPAIPPSCSIQFKLTGGCGSLVFTDTAANLAVGTGTATKTIAAFPGGHGAAATYSVGNHAPGAGGFGGGQAVGQVPLTITAQVNDSTFINTPPPPFINWGFNTTIVTVMSVTPYIGANGVNGIQGAVATTPPTFTLPVATLTTTVPQVLTPGNSLPGLAAGAGGAGCGSNSVLVPGAGGAGFVWVHSF